MFNAVQILQTLVSVWLQENHTFCAVTEGLFTYATTRVCSKPRGDHLDFDYANIILSTVHLLTQLAPLPQGFLACSACPLSCSLAYKCWILVGNYLANKYGGLTYFVPSVITGRVNVEFLPSF